MRLPKISIRSWTGSWLHTPVDPVPFAEAGTLAPKRRGGALRDLRLKITAKALDLEKWVYWHWQSQCPIEKDVLIIVGCQRSGTTLLNRIFRCDVRVTALSEDNRLTGVNGSRLRLKPFAEVNRLLPMWPTPLIVFKPLVESQNTPEMLAHIRRCRAVWIFRHYRDVVASMLRRFQRQVVNLRRIVDREAGDWRAEKVSVRTHRIISRFYDDDMSRAEAAALFWYARNVLFFERNLDRRPSVLLCRYEDLATCPEQVMRRIYRFADFGYPERHLARDVDDHSIGGGRSISLDPAIESLCRSLQERLDRHCETVSP